MSAAALAFMAPLAACGGGSGTSGGENGTVLLITESRSLDPALGVVAAVNDGQRLSAIYDLLMYTDQATGKVQPHIAESATASPDGKTWTLKIRPGVTFTDGTPYDAEAVKFNWDRFADPALRSALASSVRGVQTSVVDPLTLQIVLAEPNQHFDQVIAGRLGFIGSPTAIKAMGSEFGTKPVGAGPYKVKEWVRDAHLSLEANPSYWQPDRPKLKTLTFKATPDDGQRVNNIKSGAAQIAVTANYTAAARGQDAGFELVRPPLSGGAILLFNTTRKPFDDVRARLAVVHALDPNVANQQVNLGRSAPASNMFREDSPYYDPAGTQKHDRAEAQRLFDELAAEGRTVEFQYTTIANSPAARAQAEWVQAQLQTLRNVKVSIEFVETSIYNQKLINRDYNMSVQALAFTDPEPALYDFGKSTSSLNMSGWSNPAVDAALDRGRLSTDPATRIEAYKEVSRLVAQEVPMWIYERSATTVFGSKFKDLTLVNDGIILFDRYGVS